MADVAALTAVPWPRCGAHVELTGHRFCTNRAEWVRPSPLVGLAVFVCGEHAVRGDVPIAGECLIRRLSVFAEVLFTAITPDARLAQNEAVARLERAVEHAGGLVNVQGVTSTVGRWTVPPADSPRKG